MAAEAKAGPTSAPIPKFASTRGTSDANFGIKRGTSSFMILVRVLNLKFLHELAAQMIGTSNSPH
jgi:hypothetical protein